MTIFLVVII